MPVCAVPAVLQVRRLIKRLRGVKQLLKQFFQSLFKLRKHRSNVVDMLFTNPLSELERLIKDIHAIDQAGNDTLSARPD